MIIIRVAGVNVGIDNRYDLTGRLQDWIVDGEPDFTVRVTEEELDREDEGRGLERSYLEFICVYRHIAERMPEYDAFVFHGAAMVVDDLAYLFTAPSGTGKTTHTRMWYHGLVDHDRWCLNGDKPILRRTPEGFLVCGTPWRGKENFGCNAERPIQAICLLNRGTENRIRRADPELMVRFLFRQIYLPQEPAHLDRVLSLLDECCRTVSVWTMECTIGFKAAYTAFEAMRPEN